jgi:two-component system cell cycle response regulator DivK
MAHILVVEDNPMNLRLVRDVLEYRGHQVSAAVTAEECRAAIKGPLPDLVLMDIRLGSESGEDLLREIRAEQRLAPAIQPRHIAVQHIAHEGQRQQQERRPQKTAIVGGDVVEA